MVQRMDTYAGLELCAVGGSRKCRWRRLPAPLPIQPCCLDMGTDDTLNLLTGLLSYLYYTQEYGFNRYVDSEVFSARQG